MNVRQNIAVAGIGGFASSHHEAFRELEEERLVQVAATCDPRESEMDELKDRFDLTGRGVAIFADFDAMLDSSVFDWISLATPIGLHAAMHHACVERQLSCYLEKPPTLDPLELEQMIATDARAARQTQVGFNYVYEPERLELKRRLLRGDFGALRQISVRGSWRRTRTYYERNNWAGRLQIKDTLLLDSCLGNAMAHHVHNVLFFAGVNHFAEWGSCRLLEAQLYRANLIEGADTVFLRGEMNDSVDIRLALTHACEAESFTEEKLVCEHAVIRLLPRDKIEITFTNGSVEITPVAPRSYLKENFRFFGEYVAGAPHELLSTLIHCRPFVHVNALAYLSTGQIYQVAPPMAEFVEAENYWRIDGVESLLEQFVETGDFKVLSRLSNTVKSSHPCAPADLVNLKARIATLAGSF